MQDYEVNDIIDNLPYLDKNSWEQSRLQSFVNLQINSKKQLKPTDVIQFPWDEQYSETSTNEITNEDIERLKQKSELIFKQIKENNGK